MCFKTQSKTIQQRNKYINLKLKQLDKITDARKHTKRLARTMKYHQLLTELEVAEIRQKLRQAFK